MSPAATPYSLTAKDTVKDVHKIVGKNKEEGPISYVVKKGDSLGQIAKTHKVKIRKIIKANSQFNLGLLSNWKRGARPSSNDKVGKSNRNPN